MGDHFVGKAVTVLFVNKRTMVLKFYVLDSVTNAKMNKIYV